jgi:hypothetical protein
MRIICAMTLLFYLLPCQGFYTVKVRNHLDIDIKVTVSLAGKDKTKTVKAGTKAEIDTDGKMVYGIKAETINEPAGVRHRYGNQDITGCKMTRIIKWPSGKEKEYSVNCDHGGIARSEDAFFDVFYPVRGEDDWGWNLLVAKRKKKVKY